MKKVFDIDTITIKFIKRLARIVIHHHDILIKCRKKSMLNFSFKIKRTDPNYKKLGLGKNILFLCII